MYERMSLQRDVTPTRKRICTQTQEYQRTHFDMGSHRIYEKPESVNRASYGIRNPTPTRLPQDILVGNREEPRYSLNQEARDYNPRGSYTPSKGSQNLGQITGGGRGSVKEYIRVPETGAVEKTDYITTKNLYHGEKPSRALETEYSIPQSVLELQRTRNNQVVANKNVVNLDRGARNQKLVTEHNMLTDRDIWNKRVCGGPSFGGSKVIQKSTLNNKNTSRSRTPF